MVSRPLRFLHSNIPVIAVSAHQKIVLIEKVFEKRSDLVAVLITYTRLPHSTPLSCLEGSFFVIGLCFYCLFPSLI